MTHINPIAAMLLALSVTFAAPAAAQEPDLTAADGRIVRIRGDESHGYGFFCRDGDGRTRLLAPAHLVLPQEGVQLTGGDGTRYRIGVLAVSKTRDLVVIDTEPAPPDGFERRGTEPGMTVRIGQTTEEFRLLPSPAPADLELSGGVCPGRSGLPVLDREGRAIGLAGYQTVRPGAAGQPPETRFFAIRLGTDDFEQPDPEALRRDRATLRRLREANAAFRLTLRQNSSAPTNLYGRLPLDTTYTATTACLTKLIAAEQARARLYRRALERAAAAPGGGEETF